MRRGKAPDAARLHFGGKRRDRDNTLSEGFIIAPPPIERLRPRVAEQQHTDKTLEGRRCG